MKKLIGRGAVVRKGNFALRLQPSLMEELREVAEAQDTTLNQLINVAVAEKLAALRTEAYFRDRAARADIPGALKILDRLGTGAPARPDDRITELKKKPRPRRPHSKYVRERVMAHALPPLR
jgi:hypothetical protein